MSDADKNVLNALSERLGITPTAVIKLALRRLAEQEGVSKKRVEKQHE